MQQHPPSSTVTTSFLDKNGKITIPPKIRKELGYSAGMEFSFLETENGLLLVPLLSQNQLEHLNLDKNGLKQIYVQDSQVQLEREK